MTTLKPAKKKLKNYERAYNTAIARILVLTERLKTAQAAYAALKAKVSGVNPVPTPVPAPKLSLSSAIVQAEGDSGTTAFIWTLSVARDGFTAAIPYSYAVTGSGASPANAADFGGTFPSGSSSIPAGQSSKTITVPVSGDTAVEPAESFTLTVTAAGLNTVTSTGTISNDDAPPPQPAATLRSDRSYNEVAIGTAPGTVVHVVYGISDADAATKALTPGDGRFVFGAKQADGGWPVVVGNTALVKGNFFNLTVTAGGKTSKVATIIGDYQEHMDKFRNVVVTKRPQWFNDMVARDVKNTNQHYEMGPFTATAKQSGRWHDPATWVDGTVPHLRNTRQMRRLDVEQSVTQGTLVWVMETVGTDVVNTAGFIVTIDQYTSIKDVHGGGPGTIIIEEMTDKDFEVHVDSGMAHGMFLVRHSPQVSATPRKPRIRIVHFMQEDPGVTHRMGWMLMGPHCIEGLYKEPFLFADAEITPTQTVIHVPGSYNAGWNVGDDLASPSPFYHWTADDPDCLAPAAFWGKFWNPWSEDRSGMSYRDAGFVLPNTWRGRLVSVTSDDMVTIDKPITEGRPFITKTTKAGKWRQAGRTTSFRPIIANLTRTVEFVSADPTTLQSRFSIMEMNDPQAQIRNVRGIYGGKTAIDASLFNPSGDILYDRNPAEAGAVEVTNRQNVIGRYVFHLHDTGVMPSDGQAHIVGCVEDCPPIAGHPEVRGRSVGIDSHNSNHLVAKNIVMGQRGVCWRSEVGTETTKNYGNLYIGASGDGHSTSYGQRSDTMFKADSHMGCGFSDQSRSVETRGNHVYNCTIARHMHQQGSFWQSTKNYDFNQVNPPFDALPFSDPLNGGHGSLNPTPLPPYLGYTAQGVNPIHTIDDQFVACGQGLRIFERGATQRHDSTPFDMTFDCLNTRKPGEHESYVNRYNYRDCVFGCTDPVNETAIRTGGGATWAISAIGCYIFNFARGIDVPERCNMDGFLIDNTFENVSQPVVQKYQQWVPVGSDPRDYGVAGTMGDIVQQDGVRNPATVTGPFILNEVKNWDSNTDLPLPFPRANLKRDSGNAKDGTGPFYNGVDPRSAAQKAAQGPTGFWIAPTSNLIFDWNNYDDFTVIPIHIRGAIIDSVAVSPIGLNLNPDDTTAADYLPTQVHFNEVHNRLALLHQNRCYTDGSDVKTRLHFHWRDRLTRADLPWYVDITWPNIPAAIRDKYLTTGPNVTRQNADPKRERVNTTPVSFDMTPAAFVLPEARASLIAAPEGALDVVIKTDNGRAKITYEGDGATNISVVFADGFYRLRRTGTGATTFDYAGKLVATTPTGVRTEKVVRVLVGAASYATNFDNFTGDLATQPGWGGQTGREISNGNGTSRAVANSNNLAYYDTGFNGHYTTCFFAKDANGKPLQVNFGLMNVLGAGNFMYLQGQPGGNCSLTVVGANYYSIKYGFYVPFDEWVRVEIWPNPDANGTARVIVPSLGTIFEGDCGLPAIGTEAGYGWFDYARPDDKSENPHFRRFECGPLG